jgi:dienelactone hydrolase
MPHIVLFHSILGLRPVERDLAERFAKLGFDVSTPDLFGGQTSEDYAEAFAMQSEIGDDQILKRAEAAVADAPEDAVLAGVSFGAFLVGRLWGDRGALPGALLLCGIAPWMVPRAAGLPVACHLARPDPFDEESVFTEWQVDARGVDLELHRYDGVGHYFLDPSLPDYNREAAGLCMERSLAFLRALSLKNSR